MGPPDGFADDVGGFFSPHKGRNTSVLSAAGPRPRLLDFQAKLGRGEDRKDPVVADEGRHCMDHGRTHLAYRWYVHEKRSSEPEVFVIRGSAPRVDYLCNAAYSRLPRSEQAE